MMKSKEVFKGALLSILFCLLFGAGVVYLTNRFAGFELLPLPDLAIVSRTMGSAMSQISITLAGFVLTSTAIFTAFGDKPLIKSMHKSGHANALIARMYIAIAFDLIACAIAIWAIISPSVSLLFFLTLIGLASCCFASLISVMHKLWYVLNYINTPRTDSPNDDRYETIDHTAKPIGHF
ncbi:hypothetical protein H0A58_01735 [Alcaligenaceae bacterium]|nr:hypothetical protein [Alcaligenaceae bacterium]